ncbi:sulfate transporter CysZ [Granulosicoccus sp.]|nr:sulfate transporter CysZ [Granulosicoccus sp.]
MNNPGFFQSVSYVGAGWRLVRTPGLRRFVWMPLLVNLLVFGLLGWFINASASAWLDSLTLFAQWADWWIVRALQTLLHWLMTLVLFFSLAFIFTLTANLIGAPFNGLLAERVEAHLTGEITETAPGWLSMIKSIPRLMGSEISKLLYLLICIVPLLILQFIPLINLIAPFLLFLFGAWMFALEYMDYPMGAHGALFRDVRHALRKRRRAAYGFGSCVALISTVPIINLFIMPVAVAGATALYVDHFREQTEPGQNFS